MHYLILSTPSIAYAEDISRELWLLVRPAGNETSQFYTGRKVHPDKTKQFQCEEKAALAYNSEASRRGWPQEGMNIIERGVS